MAAFQWKANVETKNGAIPSSYRNKGLSLNKETNK